MGCFRDLLQRGRKLERCFERCRRLSDINANLDYWISIAVSAVSKWVRRSVVVTFCFFEIVMSCVLVVPYIFAPQVAWAGLFLQEKSSVALLSFRALGGLLGAFAACYRKVGRMKLYLGVMIFNILLSFLVAEPPLNCRCTCRTLEGDQCRIVKNFFPWVVRVKRKHAGPLPYGPEPELSTAASTPSGGSLLGSLAPSARRWLDSASQLLGRPSRTASRTRHLRSLSQAPRKLGEDPFDDHGAMELIDLFNVTEVGIGWKLHIQIKCEIVEAATAEATADLRARLFELQCDKFSMVGQPEETSPLRLLPESLEECSRHLNCEMVALMYEQDGPDSNSTLRICQFGAPIVPFLYLEDPSHECLCPERCVPSVMRRNQACSSCGAFNTYLMYRQPIVNREEETDFEMAAFFCRMTVAFTLSNLAILDVLAVFMSIVVYAYLKNHCGDAIHSEEQFRVSTFSIGSAFGYDEDDFVAVDVTRPSVVSATPSTIRHTTSKQQVDDDERGSLEMRTFS